MKSLATTTALSALLIFAVAVPESHAGRRSHGGHGQSSSTHTTSGYGSTQASRPSHSPHAHHTVYHWKEFQPTVAKPIHDGHFHAPIIDHRPTASRLVPVTASPALTLPPPPAVNRPLVVPGSQVVLTAANLGDTPGAVTLQMNNLALPVEILNWSTEAATVRIPAMTLTSTTPALLTIVRPDGSIARTIDVALPAGATGRL